MMYDRTMRRTPVENVFLSEMVAEDKRFIMFGESEAETDDIVLANVNGLFDGTSSDEDLEDLLFDDDEYDDLF